MSVKKIACCVMMSLVPAVGFASDSSGLVYTVNYQYWKKKGDKVYYDYSCTINAKEKEYGIEKDITLGVYGAISGSLTGLGIDVFHEGDSLGPVEWSFPWQNKIEKPVEMPVYLKNDGSEVLYVSMKLSHDVNDLYRPKTDIRGLSVKLENSDSGEVKVKKPLSCTPASQNDHQ